MWTRPTNGPFGRLLKEEAQRPRSRQLVAPPDIRLSPNPVETARRTLPRWPPDPVRSRLQTIVRIRGRTPRPVAARCRCVQALGECRRESSWTQQPDAAKPPGVCAPREVSRRYPAVIVLESSNSAVDSLARPRCACGLVAWLSARTTGECRPARPRGLGPLTPVARLDTRKGATHHLRALSVPHSHTSSTEGARSWETCVTSPQRCWSAV